MTSKPAGSKGFIDLLTDTLTEKCEALCAPEGEVEPGEEVLGKVADERTKCLFTFSEMRKQALANFARSLPDGKPDSPALVLEMVKNQTILREQYEVAEKLLWLAVKGLFPKANDPRVAVAIRKDWQVVIFKSSNDNNIGSIILKLMSNQ